MQDDYERDYGDYDYMEDSQAAPSQEEVKKGAKKLCRRLGFSFTAFIGVSMLVTALAAFVISMLILARVIPYESFTVNVTLMISSGAMYLCGFPVCYLVMRGIPATVIEKKSWSLGQLAGCFIVCIGILCGGNIIGQVLMYLVGLLTGKTMVNSLDQLVRSASPLVILLGTVIIAPIAEELIFRKLLIDRTIRYGQGVSMVLSGVLFGLAHGNFYQFFYACGLGMVFAYVYMKTGKLHYTVIFHMLINFLGSMVGLELLKLMDINVTLGSILTLTYGALLVGCVVAAVVIFIVYRKRIVLEPGVEQIPKGSRFKTVFLNVGMLMYLAVCAALFVVSEIGG